MPAATSRSHNELIMSPGTGDDRPPSISHSLTLVTSTIAALPLLPGEYGQLCARALAHLEHRRGRDAGSAGNFGRCLVAQAKDALRFREAGDRKFAKLGPAFLADAGEGGRGHHGPGQFSGDLLKPSREIDGRADASEVEPARAADIAKQDLTNVEC